MLVTIGWICLIFGGLILLGALFGGGGGDLLFGAILAGAGILLVFTLNSGEEWLYRKYGKHGQAVTIPSNFAAQYKLPSTCYFVTTTNEIGEVIENHDGYQPFVVNVEMICQLPAGTMWASDPWLPKEMNDHAVFYVEPEREVLEAFRFSMWTTSESVMMDGGKILGEQRTKRAYYFEVRNVRITN